MDRKDNRELSDRDSSELPYYNKIKNTKSFYYEAIYELGCGYHTVIFWKTKENICYRVTCVICLPDMFTSELCIYLQESYFQSHTSKYENSSYEKSLAQKWGLSLPEKIKELEIKVNDKNEENIDEKLFILERWYFGEVL
jgi:Protein of unknown function (DUF3916)